MLVRTLAVYSICSLRTYTLYLVSLITVNLCFITALFICQINHYHTIHVFTYCIILLCHILYVFTLHFVEDEKNIYQSINQYCDSSLCWMFSQPCSKDTNVTVGTLMAGMARMTLLMPAPQLVGQTKQRCVEVRGGTLCTMSEVSLLHQKNMMVHMIHD